MKLMPDEDKAHILTPAEQRRSQRSAIFVFVAFLAIVLVGLAATVLAVNEGRNYRRLIRQFGLEAYLPSAPPPPSLRMNRQSPVQPAEHRPTWLLRTDIERPATFEKASSLTAEERCDELGAETDAAPTFTITQEEWECLFFESFGASAEPASIFVQARGTAPDTLHSFRVKLSFTDPLVDLDVLNGAMAAIERFGLTVTPETRAYLAEKLSRRQDFTSVLENYRMTFSQEMTDDRRYNLIVLPRAQTIDCKGTSPSSPGRPSRPTYHFSLGCLPLRTASSGPQPAS